MSNWPYRKLSYEGKHTKWPPTRERKRISPFLNFYLGQHWQETRLSRWKGSPGIFIYSFFPRRIMKNVFPFEGEKVPFLIFLPSSLWGFTLFPLSLCLSLPLSLSLSLSLGWQNWRKKVYPCPNSSARVHIHEERFSVFPRKVWAPEGKEPFSHAWKGTFGMMIREVPVSRERDRERERQRERERERESSRLACKSINKGISLSLSLPSLLSLLLVYCLIFKRCFWLLLYILSFSSSLFLLHLFL